MLIRKDVSGREWGGGGGASYFVYPVPLRGCWATTDNFTTIPVYLVLSSAALHELANTIPLHGLILSFHFLSFHCPLRNYCLCQAKRPCTLSFCFFTRIRNSSYSPMAVWILLRYAFLISLTVSVTAVL